MQHDAPQPSVSTLLFQCIAVLFFGVCLYLFCDAYQTNKNYDVALSELQERKFQLNRASKQVDNYMNFVQSNPFFQSSIKAPQWEKIAENWEDLPFPALLQRFASLYDTERPFILDYFSVSGGKDSSQTDTASRGETEGEELPLTFIVQGYYLCPCQ